ncbi:hypothetical protein MKX03_002564 [Papaver bracteatum]|nr:hypothetical protein MKX03_002564 [Papaver bracteatum]
MMRIEVLKKLRKATLSSLSMPEGKTGLFKKYFELFAILCDRLWWMQRKGSEDLVLPLIIDSFISRLCANLRIQGLEGLEYFATQGIPSSFIPPRREIKNTASGDPTKPAKHSLNDAMRKRKSEGEENGKCPICLDFIKDEKEEKGTVSWPNCSHRFHFHCILKRMYKKPNCPLCKSGIFPKKKRQRECRRRLT